MLLLEQDTTRKEQVEKTTSQLESDDSRKNDKEYKFEAIRNSEVYTRESDHHLPGLYYVIF